MIWHTVALTNVYQNKAISICQETWGQDWRTPNLIELLMIYDYGANTLESVFDAQGALQLWTANTDSAGQAVIRKVLLATGHVGIVHETDTDQSAVICISSVLGEFRPNYDATSNSDPCGRS